jgi:hypothetical protein
MRLHGPFPSLRNSLVRVAIAGCQVKAARLKRIRPPGISDLCQSGAVCMAAATLVMDAS